MTSRVAEQVVCQVFALTLRPHRPRDGRTRPDHVTTILAGSKASVRTQTLANYNAHNMVKNVQAVAIAIQYLLPKIAQLL